MRCTPSIIIDRSELFREGLAQLLSSSCCRIIAAVGRLDDIPATAHHEDSLLFILTSDGSAAGSVASLRQTYPHARILVLATTCDPNEMCESMRLGANGYLSKSISLQVLVKSLELLLDDVPIAPIGLMGDISPPSVIETVRLLPNLRERASLHVDPAVAHHHNLSEQELRVTLLLARGCTNKVVAINLDITEATVKAHVKAILRKIRVQNRTQAALWAIENGLVPTHDSSSVPILPEIGSTHQVFEQPSP